MRCALPFLLILLGGGVQAADIDAGTDAGIEDRERYTWETVQDLRRAGRNVEALELLNHQDLETTFRISVLRAAVLAGRGHVERALEMFDEMQNEAAAQPVDLQAFFLTEHANVMLLGFDAGQAQAYFERAAELARRIGRSDLVLVAELNRLRMQIEDKNLAGLEEAFDSVAAQLREQQQGEELARLWLTFGQLRQRAQREFNYPEQWLALALDAYSRVQQVTGKPDALGWSFGLSGALYEQAGRVEEALLLTGRALFHAQQAYAPAQIYRWDWQLGRLYRQQGDLDAAQAAYARAVNQLDEVRKNMVRGSGDSFVRLVEPVYREFADVTLAQAALLQDGTSQQSLLREVRDRLETLKQAEVEDYFANECLATDAVAERYFSNRNAAILYPVLLEDRLEMLIEIDGHFSRFATPVGRNRLTNVVRTFRRNLERSTAADDFMEQAVELYDWLVRPGLTLLDENDIQTLVVVPEGPLRTIPISALHSGNSFLIEERSVATTPAINLTRQRGLAQYDSLLVGGVSKPVQGFAELPSVERELSAISSLYETTAIQDEEFKLQIVSSALGDVTYSVAHFATHGEVNRDYRKSFLLTYDDKLTLNRLQSVLQERQDEPLDLLVLSACQTAAGDDRAALGLAGIAVQSGAKSALASLWSISDSATAELVEHFYDGLLDQTTKADSLRQAQLSLLASDEFNHPAFWAPYLLIGNWL